MTIAVFGAGGVGSFYGGLLAKAGHDVRFVARGRQLEMLRTRGLHISSTALGEIDVAPVTASDCASDLGLVDLVLVCVKAHQTAGVLDDIAPLVGERTLLMALQNGIESDEVLASRFGAGRVVSCVVYVGATLEEPGLVRHVAAGTLVIGESFRLPFDVAQGTPSGSRGVKAEATLPAEGGSYGPEATSIGSERLERVREVLASTGLPVRVVADIERQRWHKLAWNASFNAVSALTLRTSQELLAMPETRALLVGVMREVVAVARAGGVSLSEADIDKLVGATENAAPIRTSMLVDRERGRPMEVDALVGVVVRRGKEAGVQTPATEILYSLLKALSQP